MGRLEYNYEFLAGWIKSTDTPLKYVMQAVGNSSSNNLHDWLGDGPAQRKMEANGEEVKPVPMNVLSILKFCNHFNVPLECFFLENSQPARLRIPMRISTTAEGEDDRKLREETISRAPKTSSPDSSSVLMHDLDMARLELRMLHKQEDQTQRYINLLERENERLQKEINLLKKNKTYPLPDTANPYPRIDDMEIPRAAEEIYDPE